MWIHEVTPGISDLLVLSRATAERRTLITFDKDFGELVFRVGLKPPSGIILIRILAPPSVVGQTIAAILDRTLLRYSR